MYQFNLKEACLLDASGELSAAAHKELLAYVRQNPAAMREFERIQQRYALLQALPLPEPSAAERAAIPAYLKAAVRHTLKQQKAARQRELRRHWAISGAAAAAAGLFVTILVGIGVHVSEVRERALAATAMIDQVAQLSNQPATEYEQAFTSIDASLRQLQKESPTLSNLHDNNMSALMEALVSLPRDDDYSPNGPFWPSSSF